jgi:DNA-directed RNA polymerase
MRTKDSPEQEQYVRLASENGTMDQVFTALTALGNTAWRINRPLFDVIAKVWNMGDRFGVIPPDNATTKIAAPAPPPTDLALDPSQKQAYQVEMNNVRQARTKAHSQRCNLNYKLEIARAVSKPDLLVTILRAKLKLNLLNSP